MRGRRRLEPDRPPSAEPSQKQVSQQLAAARHHRVLGEVGHARLREHFVVDEEVPRRRCGDGEQNLVAFRNAAYIRATRIAKISRTLAAIPILRAAIMKTWIQ